MVLSPVKLMSDYFAAGEVQKIMIHFPDPWPKPRQQKNRLLSVDFCARRMSLCRLVECSNSKPTTTAILRRPRQRVARFI